MFEDLKGSLLRGDVATVAAGLLLALAAFSLIEAVVANLLGPLIGVLVNEPDFSFASFTTGSNEFRYGSAILGALLFALGVATAYLLLAASGRRR